MQNKMSWLIAIIVFLLAALLLQTGYVFHLQGRRGLPLSIHARRVDKNSPFSSEAMVTPAGGTSFVNNDANFDDWDPFQEMERIQRQMNRMFRDSFEKASHDKNFEMLSQKGFFEPDMDLKDTGKAYVVRMDAPGLSKDEINVDLRGNLLSVSGERKSDVDEKQEGFVKKERSFGYFSRAVSLPEDINAQGIKADYDKGVLVVTIPKAAKTAGINNSGTKIKVN